MSETAYEGHERGHEQTASAVSDISDNGTVRDRVWDATLSLLATRPIPFQAWRVRRRAGLDSSQDRSIRRTLTVMAEAGWLEHEHGSKWYHPGERAKEAFDGYE